jgi:uncharacterized membrane protein YhaH (DUF805 family)
MFFSAKGRVGRKDFWIASLLLVVLEAPLRLFGVVGALLALGLTIPHICLFAKRLHDLGRSGWLAAAPFGLATLTGALSGVSEVREAAGSPMPAFALAMLGVGCAVVGVAFFLRIALARNGQADNRFGPAPEPLFDRKKPGHADLGVF